MRCRLDRLRFSVSISLSLIGSGSGGGTRGGTFFSCAAAGGVGGVA